MERKYSKAELVFACTKHHRDFLDNPDDFYNIADFIRMSPEEVGQLTANMLVDFIENA